MKNFEEILKEDLTYQQGLTSGMDWTGRTVPSNMTLTDILQMGNSSLTKTGTFGNFPNEMANIENNFRKIISDAQELMNMYKNSLKNPVIKHDKFKIHIVSLNIKRFEQILKLYKEIYEDLHYLNLDQ